MSLFPHCFVQLWENMSYLKHFDNPKQNGLQMLTPQTLCVPAFNCLLSHTYNNNRNEPSGGELEVERCLLCLIPEWTSGN